MLNFIKKHKLILILLIFTLFLLINTKVNAAEDLETVRSSILKTLTQNGPFKDEGTGVDFVANPDLYGCSNVNLDKTIIFYFIYDNPLEKCYDVISIGSGYPEIKRSGNWGWYSTQSRTEHYVRTATGTDWRCQTVFIHHRISYDYEFISRQRKDKVNTTNLGIISMNEYFGITSCIYDNLLMVSPNYIDRFKVSFPDFEEHTSNNILPSFNIELSTSEKSLEPIYAYSNYFDISTLNRYEVFISLDNINYKKMNIETMNYLDGTCEYRYNYKIFSNGTYYFKFIDNETNEETIITYEITNILSNSTNFGFTIDGIPQPFVTYSRIIDQFILQTQSFTYENFEKLECYYTTDPTLDYSSWDKMSLGTLNNTITGTVEYYFFFSVPQYSEDTTYYFVFYDTTLQKYGYKSSLNCIFDKMNEYEDNVSGVIDEKNSKFNELIQFFNKRLGFLTYPFEFIINLLNKILTINYEEPILHFPQIINPLDDTIIFEGFNFNFNSILEYEGIAYFYNIYLIAVDFILVVAFIKGCKHIIEGVFGNG